MAGVAGEARRRAWGAIALAVTIAVLAACSKPESAASDAAAVAAAAPAVEAAATGADETVAGEGTTAEAGAGAVDSGAAAVAPADGAEFNGMLVGFTAEGFPFRGDPNAPITMYEWSDFQCPFCSRYFVQTESAINDAYVREGKVRVVFRDLPLQELHPNAPAAHDAARCVAQQGAPLFWAMHDQLFRAQAEWEGLADPRPVFERLAGEVGADVTAVQACTGGAAEGERIQASLEEAARLGIDGTPSFRLVDNASGQEYLLVGAQPFERFAEVLDAVLAGEAPAVAQGPEPPPSIPEWATPAGLAVDPARPGYTVAGDFTRGNPDASVVVIEFSDYQCPFCKKHHDETQPALDEAFVDSGEVRWVFKHFPLNFHPQAPAAGVAAECAAAQGKFWEMGDRLFASVEEWSQSDPAPVFKAIAGDLGLDAEAFAACLDEPAMMAQVTSDMDDGRPYVQGTPTFIILSGEGGRIIPGALPLATFSAELQRVLDAAGS